MALARLPGCGCPAPRAGANDCKRCPAHLLHFRRRPAVEAFVAALGANGSGGYAVHHQRH